jgi:hypothetical protein
VNANGATNEAVGLVERNGMFWLEDLPLAAGTNTIELTATDAAGNVNTTSFNLVQSSVTLTIESTPRGEVCHERCGPRHRLSCRSSDGGIRPGVKT